MPNLNIVSAPSASQAQTQASQDSGDSQAVESFGSVLARQQAIQESSDDTQAVPADDASAATDGAGILQDVKEVRPDITSLLLAADRDNVVTAKEEGELKALIPDKVAALSGDMLLALAPGSITRQGAVVLQTDTSGESAEAKAALPSFVSTKGHGEAASSDDGAGAIRGGAFQAALETLGKHSPSPVRLLDSAQTSLQPAQDSAFPLAGLSQNGATSLAPAANVTTQLQLNTPLTSSGWGDELSQKIVWMTTQREQIAELRLNPPNLGPLEVVISVSDDQATALFTSQHAAVRHAVEQALPRLREMLAESGITLGNATVSDQPPREQQAAHDNNQRNDGRWPDSADETGVTSGSQTGMFNWPGRRHEGMVDTFA